MDALRVLVVDDEEELVSALTERLALRGFKTHGITDGEEALAHLEDQSYDVILVDVKMPGLGGIELMERIKELHPQVEVILLTGRGTPEDAERGRTQGAFEYLTKPVQISHLIQVLRRAGHEDSGPGGAP